MEAARLNCLHTVALVHPETKEAVKTLKSFTNNSSRHKRQLKREATIIHATVIFEEG
jgi:hypothetical protein